MRYPNKQAAASALSSISFLSAVPFLVLLMAGCGQSNTDEFSQTADETSPNISPNNTSNSLNTWRLKHSQVAAYQTRTVDAAMSTGDFSLSYDENHEIASIDQFYVEDDLNASPCFANGDLIGSEVFTNHQASQWSVTGKIKTDDGNPSITAPCVKSKTLSTQTDYVEWGDKRLHSHLSDSGQTPQSEKTGPIKDTPNAPAPTSVPIKPPSDEATPFLPIETYREYDKKGHLAFIRYANPSKSGDIDQEAHLQWDEESLAQVAMSVAGSNDSTGTQAAMTFSAESLQNMEYHYDYSLLESGIVKTRVYAERDGQMQQVMELTATYEQAECGPLTLERSKKFVPHPFPVCFER